MEDQDNEQIVSSAKCPGKEFAWRRFRLRF